MDAALPPGPRLPGFVQAAVLLTGQHRLLKFLHRRYGDRFSLKVPSIGRVIYLADPRDIKEVFRGDPAVFHAGEANFILSGILGTDSVLLVDGEQHRRSRALMTPAFHGDSVRRQTEDMAEITRREVASWPAGEAFALHPRMQAITLEVILSTVIGVDDPTRLARLRKVLPELVDIGNPAQLLNPPRVLRNIGPWRRRRRTRERADELLYEQIASHRAAPDLAERTDVLAMMLRAVDESGRSMPDKEVRDQIVTLLLAGHETTATGLAWTFERMLRHPEVLERARQAALTGDDTYLDALSRESLRARPVVFEVGRVVQQSIELAGHRVPAGTVLVPSIELVHGSARHYRDPGDFRPERFLNQRVDTGTWFPFGGGIRRCLGATFATVEMRVVLREILRRVEFETTVSEAEPAVSRHVTLVPKHGARARVRVRAVDEVGAVG